MNIEVPQISNISVSDISVLEKKCTDISLQNLNEAISDDVDEGKVLETVLQSGNSYDEKHSESETENVKIAIQKVEDLDVNISSPEGSVMEVQQTNTVPSQHEIDTPTIAQNSDSFPENCKSTERENARISRENIDENMSLPMDQEEENVLSLPFSEIRGNKSSPSVDQNAGKEQCPHKPPKLAHQFCFQATSNEGYSDISSVSSDSGMSSFNMELYRKSPYYKQQPVVKKEQEM